jgi:hypothetical protein
MPARAPRRWDWGPKLRWFAAEFLVVVTGVLVALALNAWWQGRQDVASEEDYLAFLSRDLQSTLNDLGQTESFEAVQVQVGLTAYRALSARTSPEDRQLVSQALSKLFTRHTLVLDNATYEDLISTGNLKLIRNRKLRDRIVDFYERTERVYEIVNKNNSFFVDDMYNANVIFNGLVMPRTSTDGIASLSAVDAMLAEELRPGYIDEPDRLWTLPQDAPEWSVLKANLLMRIRVAALAQFHEKNLMEEVRELKEAVDSERSRL